MLKLEMRDIEMGQKTSRLLTVVKGDKWIMSLPAHLNEGTVPSLAQTRRILKGESINLEPLLPITVFRVENKKTSNGMYNSESDPGLDACPFYSKREKKKLHPAPWQDSKMALQMYALGLFTKNPMAIFMTGSPMTQKSQEWSYAFASKEQMRMWLHEDRIIEWLAEHNFIVAEITVKPFDALVGNTQAMFRNRPKRCKKHDLREFLQV